MQPDPEVFLPAVRAELTSPALFGAALHEGVSPLIMHRAAETLAQLQLRHQRLPGILHPMLPGMFALLQPLLQEYPELDVIIAPALTLYRQSGSGIPGEVDVHALDAWTDAVSSCIARLHALRQEKPEAGPILAALRSEASRFELQLRERCAEELAAIKHEQVAASAASALPQPTASDVTAVLRRHFPSHPRIGARDISRIPGVTTKETFFFELENLPGWPPGMVLRREASFNPTRTLVADEVELLGVLHRSGIPVPRVLVGAHHDAALGGGFIIVERLAGMPRTAAEWGPAARGIALEIAAIMARIHRVDARRLASPFGANSGSAREQFLSRIDYWYERWLNGRVETAVALEAAYSWLRDNIGCIGPDLSLVHGDCNFRNILLDGDRVSAILDWELAHPGHAAEDLSYIQADIEQILPWRDFLDAYLAHGGVPVSDAMLHFFRFWADVWRATLAANCYSAFVRGEHRSYLYASVGHNEYFASLDPLCAAMARAGQE